VRQGAQQLPHDAPASGNLLDRGAPVDAHHQPGHGYTARRR
jgi:hypothetical protein